MPRKRHVSRNSTGGLSAYERNVMPRKRHVSRNAGTIEYDAAAQVMPRKRHVSRNDIIREELNDDSCHASQEACE